MIRLLVSDVDGTLLNSQSELTSAVIDAVHKLTASGVVFAIASGRNIEAIHPISKAFGGGMAALALNGGQIFNAEGQMLQQLTLPEEAVRPMLEISQLYRCFTALFFDSGVYTPDPMKEALTKMTEGYMPLYHLNFDQAEHMCRRTLEDCQVETLPQNWNWQDQSFLKVRYVFSRKEDCAAATEKLRDLPGISLFPTDYDLEVTPLGADKGSAALALGKLLGIENCEIAVMGDSSNDRSMLSLFDLSFALGNSDPETKKCANYVVEDNDHDGAAEVVEWICKWNETH